MKMWKVNNKYALKFLSLIFLALAVFSISAVAQTASTIEELVKQISGGKLKVETKATPYKIVGDFDGDKVDDIAVIVSLADTPANVAQKVKVQFPYYKEKEVSNDDLALYIIHGQGKGWESAQKSSILFLGRNSALIFQKERLGEAGDGMQLKKDKKGGTIIEFVTESARGTMKWNKKGYVWTESHY